VIFPPCGRSTAILTERSAAEADASTSGSGWAVAPVEALRVLVLETGCTGTAYRM
jgi:hypothetical protein